MIFASLPEVLTTGRAPAHHRDLLQLLGLVVLAFGLYGVCGGWEKRDKR